MMGEKKKTFFRTIIIKKYVNASQFAHTEFTKKKKDSFVDFSEFITRQFNVIEG